MRAFEEPAQLQRVEGNTAEAISASHALSDAARPGARGDDRDRPVGCEPVDGATLADRLCRPGDYAALQSRLYRLLPVRTFRSGKRSPIGTGLPPDRDDPRPIRREYRCPGDRRRPDTAPARGAGGDRTAYQRVGDAAVAVHEWDQGLSRPAGHIGRSGFGRCRVPCRFDAAAEGLSNRDPPQRASAGLYRARPRLAAIGVLQYHRL